MRSRLLPLCNVVKKAVHVANFPVVMMRFPSRRCARVTGGGGRLEGVTHVDPDAGSRQSEAPSDLLHPWNVRQPTVRTVVPFSGTQPG